MPRLTVNGKDIEVPAGTNLIEAARHAGVEVPHYCYHPGLSIAGQCRLCMVDIEKTPRPTIACNTLAADGMVVSTETDRVRETRKSIMEFHLINHPLDCPVCVISSQKRTQREQRMHRSASSMTCGPSGTALGLCTFSSVIRGS